MKAAVVQEIGKPPVYADFVEPVLGDGEVRITVAAAALSQLTRGRAAGRHYSSQGTVPFVTGVDGVGKLDSGKRVYFMMPKPPQGSMAERVSIRRQQTIPVPDDLDDITAAAIANAGMSSWAALKERAKFRSGETVLINGATGTSGKLAVQIAKHLGAKRIVATGRNADVLKEVAEFGAEIIQLTENPDELEETFGKQFAGGIDVVLDYLWGPSAERLLIAAAKAGKAAVPIRFVQIGSVTGADISLSSSVLRSSSLELLGSGLGSVPFDRLLVAISEVFSAAVPGDFKIATEQVPLAEVEQVWEDKTRSRVVFTV